MGQTTPNIGIYIMAAGESDYDQSFAAGMVNIDQHDHSGGPNKGLPIATEGLGAFSVTFDKLNANVVDQSSPGSGIGVSGAFPNQLVLLDPLKSIFQLAPTNGFLALNGTSAFARTFQNSASITWTNGNGTGNPEATVVPSGIGTVPVSSGGTGVITLVPYAPILGGTTSTGPVQQPALGNAGEVFTSQGAGMPGIFAPSGGLTYSTVTLTAAQVRALNVTPVEIAAAPGAGKVLVPVICYGLLTSDGTAFVGGASTSIAIGYSFGSGIFAVQFNSSAFKSTIDLYSWATQSTSTGSGSPKSDVQNSSLTLFNPSTAYTAGGSSTITIVLGYVTITL